MKEEHTLELVLKEGEGELFHDGQRRANEDFAAGAYSKTVHQYAADDVSAGYSYEWNRLKNPPPARQEGETPRTDAHVKRMTKTPDCFCESDFARSLERELSAKQAEVERLNKLLQKRIGERDEKSWRLHNLETLVGPYVQWDEESDYPSFTGELESLKAAQGWRLISEHPHDGTEFHAWDGKSIFYRLYRSMDHGELIWRQAWFSPDLPCTRYEDFPQEWADKLTHWMPLPTPPVERSVDGE